MTFFRCSLALTCLVVFTQAIDPGQAGSFNVTPGIGEKYGCDAKCQALVNYANVDDLQNTGTLLDYDFYDTAANFSSSQPGDLLKLQPMNSTNLNVGFGTSVYRFQYTTRDIDGSPVPATGFIAIPFTLPQSGQFRPVVYSHSSVGVSRSCAPSNGPALFEADTWRAFIDRGYAVIGPDFAGLGNNYTTLKFGNSWAYAEDMYYSMLAARKAFPGRFTDEWSSFGVYQGAGGIWKLSEHPLVQDPDSGYLGGAAVGPTPRYYDYAIYGVNEIFSKPNYEDFGAIGEIPFAALAVKRTYPEYNYTMLGDTMKRRMGLIDELQLCTNAILVLVLDLPMSELLSFDRLRNDTTAQKFQQVWGAATGARAATPLWVGTGTGDTFVTSYSALEPAAAACSYGNDIDIRIYTDLDHEPTTAASTPDWMQWIEDRFNGVERPSGCTNITQTPFNLATAKNQNEWAAYLEVAASIPSA